jgi:hypothetical protein
VAVERLVKTQAVAVAVALEHKQVKRKPLVVQLLIQ